MTRSTLVTHIRVAAGALTVDPPIVVGLSTSDAGAADVNGDGAPDLVLAGYIGAGTTDCPPSALAVVSGQDSTLVVPPADRAARREEQRSAGRGRPRRVGRRSRHRPAGQRVRDLFEPRPTTWSRITWSSSGSAMGPSSWTARPLSAEMATAGPWPSKPLVLDVDGDGRNEAVIATDAGLRIVDPTDDWRSVPIPGPRAVPLAARSTAGQPGTSVTWLESLDDPVAGPFGSARVTPGRRQDPGRSTDLPAVAGHRGIGHPRRGAPARERRDRAAAALCPGGATSMRTAARTSSSRWPGSAAGPRRRGPDRAGSILARSDSSVRRRIRGCSSRPGSIGFRTRAARRSRRRPRPARPGRGGPVRRSGSRSPKSP